MPIAIMILIQLLFYTIIQIYQLNTNFNEVFLSFFLDNVIGVYILRKWAIIINIIMCLR